MEIDIVPIEPIDIEKCQAESLSGSFMTLGPRQMVQCISPPKYFAVEKVPAKDGLIGAMSLCEDCLNKFVAQTGPDFAHIFRLKEKNTPMTWQKKLTKKEIKHLHNVARCYSLEQFKKIVDYQQECRKTYNDAPEYEPCWDCRHIAVKLGLIDK